MCPNGPAIWGGCVTRRSIRAGSWYFRHEFIPVRGGYGTCFCGPGTNFIACWRDPGTSLNGATRLSPVTKFGEGTCAASGYNLSRSKKFVKVYWILIGCRCGNPGAKTITNLSWVQEQKQKP